MSALLRQLAITLLPMLPLFAATPSAQAQALLQNGSFENNGGDGSSFVPGWTFAGPGIHGATYARGATDGSYSALFNYGNSSAGGTVSQTFTTVPGRIYRVSFDFGALAAFYEISGPQTSRSQLQVEVRDGASTTSGNQTIHSGSGTTSGVTGGVLVGNGTAIQVKDESGTESAEYGPVPNGEFSAVGFIFTAQSTTSTIVFTDQSAGGIDRQDVVLDNVRMTVVAPDLSVGTPVDNIPGATVSVLYPGDLSPDGTFYTRAKLKGVPAILDECILAWDGTTATALVREGDLMDGEPIKSFSDPLVRSDITVDPFIHIAFSAKLLQNGTSVTAANDDVNGEWVSANGLFVLLREGDTNLLPGHTLVKMNWLHRTRYAGSYAGIQLKADGTTTMKNAIWNGNTGMVAYVGGPVEVNGVTETIKTIGAPIQAPPVAIQTRIGNDYGISVLVKTVEGHTLIKQFLGASR